MALKKIDKETAIKLILSDLKKGISKASILQKLSENYNNSQKSFYNYFDAAEILYKEFLLKATPIIEAKEIEALGEAAKMGILSKLERQKILSDIATGKLTTWKEIGTKDGIQKAHIFNPIQAIAELNKMDGSYFIEDEEGKDEEITEIKITRIGIKS
jgi:hypothetical protein